MTPSAKRNLKLTIDGKPYEVAIGDINESPIQVSVNGKPYTVELESSQVTAPAGRPQAPATPAATEVVAPPIKRKQTVAASGASATEVRSPMPGDILDIKVKPGDQVEVGQHLCSLEAMKMKSAIRSARQGVIAAVEVSEGQAVAHGDVLVTFE